MAKYIDQDIDTADTLKRLVVKSAVRKVDPNILQVDPSYQREIKGGHKKIVADFNPQAFGIPLVGQRDDNSLWIVDGLQRITAVKKLGHKEVRVEVFASDGPEHEAGIFSLVNIGRTKLSSQEKFRAMLAAHDPLAWEIKEAVESVGYHISMGKSGTSGSAAKQLTCISTLVRIGKSSGMEPIKFALNCADQAWPEDRFGVWAPMVAGLCYFYLRHDGLIDMERFVAKLTTVPPQKVLYKASQLNIGHDKEFSVVEVLEEINRKRLVKK